MDQRAGPPESEPEPLGKPIGRRIVLGMLGLGAVGVVAGPRVQSALNDVLRPVERAIPSGVDSLLPGSGGFRYYTITSGFPYESTGKYWLRVDGMVDRPATLSYEQLMALPATRLVRPFQCVTGWRVPKVHWEGVRLSDLLDHVGVSGGGTALRFFSFDGAYTESLTLDQARRPDVLVAYRMLGAPITTDHGGPVRLYVAPMYGYKSIKWLSRIEVVDRVYPGYWEQEGYSVNAWVGRSNGRDDPPT